MNVEKAMTFTGQLENVINESIDGNSDLFEDDIFENMTEFVTAVCVLLPHQILKKYTEENIKNFLDSNHLANSLCVQFMQAMRDKYGNTKEDKEEK